MAYSDIKDPSAHFQTVLWTGNGSRPVSITGVGFQPDMVWAKNRTNNYNHVVYDSSRGAGQYKEITPNQLYEEGGNNAHTYGYLSSFDSDGFSSTDSNYNAYFNENGNAFVSWNWKANGGTTTSVSASGSGANCINASTHQVNQDAGFSIITYTGRADQITVHQQTNLTHGLGVTPDLTIMKKRGSTGDWVIMGKHITTSSAYSANEHLHLNTTDAISNAEYTGYVAPTSTYIYLGDALVNDTGATYVCYAFAEKQGYSKFGKYVGNGNADGPFVYTGFKPAFLMMKEVSSAGGNWVMFDNKRDTFNVTKHRMFPNLVNSDNTTRNYIDLLSNGFKMRDTDADHNQSGQTMIYMAFAENPFVAGGIPTTAR
jgi:hypothetical protein